MICCGEDGHEASQLGKASDGWEITDEQNPGKALFCDHHQSKERYSIVIHILLTITKMLMNTAFQRVYHLLSTTLLQNNSYPQSTTVCLSAYKCSL